MKHINGLLKKVGKGQDGFTLIELLIVIVVLGIIAAVVVLNIGGFLGTGNLEAANTEADTVRTAVMANMADNGGTYTGPDEISGSPSGGIESYLVGKTIKGTYTVDVTDPCTFSAVDNGDWPTTITWNDSTGDPPCQWVKAPSEGG